MRLYTLVFIFGTSLCFTASAPADQRGNLGVGKTDSYSGCTYAGCTSSNYGAVGDLHVTDDGDISSTFGGKTDTWWTHFGGGASADGHLAHIVRNAGNWGRMEVNVGKVGANAFAGGEGVGAGVSATLGEAGGKIGHGPLSIGGKVGLSADTGVRIGPNTEVKVLGTGFAFGSEHGFQACLFGSCLSIG